MRSALKAILLGLLNGFALTIVAGLTTMLMEPSKQGLVAALAGGTISMTIGLTLTCAYLLTRPKKQEIDKEPKNGVVVIWCASAFALALAINMAILDLAH